MKLQCRGGGVGREDYPRYCFVRRVAAGGVEIRANRGVVGTVVADVFRYSRV